MGVTPSRGPPGPPGPCLFNHNILEEIFLHVPDHQVVRVCRLVCRRWREVADTESFWRKKCRREGCVLCDDARVPSDWRVFYFLSKKRRNLLKNPSGEDQLKGWSMFGKRPNRWIVKGLRQPHPNREVQRSFATSYGMCVKGQLIDLKKEGYSAAFMDKFQPAIRVTDWFSALWDCGSEYVIRVELLNRRKTAVAGFAPDPIVSGRRDYQGWNQLIHVFQHYGPGVRYIRFSHGGKVRRFWGEYCGIHIADSCIEIFPAGAS